MSTSEIELLQNIRTTAVRSRDSTTNATKTVDYPHHEVHDGRAFVVTDVSELGDGGIRRIRFQTPDTTRWSHMIPTITTGLAAQAWLYEATTLQHVVANVLTPRNRNRNSTNVSGMTICHTPLGNSSSSSGEAVEVILATQAWGTPGKGASPGFGGSARGSAEWVLKQNTAYLVEVISAAASNAVSIELDWYEHINK